MQRYCGMENTTTLKKRYNDSELEEFKQVILHKLNIAREELADLSASLQSSNPNCTDDTAGTYATLEDGAATMDKESIHSISGPSTKIYSAIGSCLGSDRQQNLR